MENMILFALNYKTMSFYVEIKITEKKELEVGLKINKILSTLMEQNNVSLTMLHRNTGIAIPTLKRLQSDPTANPTLTTLLPIADFFQISIAQLAGKEVISQNHFGYRENRTYWQEVPLLPWEEIGNWLKQKGESLPKREKVIIDIDAGEFPYALIVEENEWLEISKNSILIINPSLIPENKDYIICQKKGHSPTLKQILFDEEKKYLKSLSPYLPINLFEEDHCCLGVLVQIRKNIKK